MATQSDSLKEAYTLYGEIHKRISDHRKPKNKGESILDSFAADDRLKEMLASFSECGKQSHVLSQNLSLLRQFIANEIVSLCHETYSIEPFVSTSEHLIVTTQNLTELISVVKSFSLDDHELRSFLLDGVTTAFYYDSGVNVTSAYKSDMLYLMAIASDCLNDREMDQLMDALFPPASGQFNGTAYQLLPEIIVGSSKIILDSLGVGDKGLMVKASIRWLERTIDSYPDMVVALGYNKLKEIAKLVFANDFSTETKSKFKGLLAGRLDISGMHDIAASTGAHLTLAESIYWQAEIQFKQAKEYSSKEALLKLIKHKEFRSMLLYSLTKNDLFKGIDFPASTADEIGAKSSVFISHLLLNFPLIKNSEINDAIAEKYTPFISTAFDNCDSISYSERTSEFMSTPIGKKVLSKSIKAKRIRTSNDFEV